MANVFSQNRPAAPGGVQVAEQPPSTGGLVDYSVCPVSRAVHIVVFAVGVAAGFGVLYLFYRHILLSLVGGIIIAPMAVNFNAKNAIKKRLINLRGQFRDMLEAMNVSMRAGSNEIKALQSAYNDLLLIYPPETDMVQEVANMLNLYNNGKPLRTLFRDLADRSGLEDIASFASIFEAIEGKSDRSTDVIRQTQRVIADKIAIEAEIETMITSTKSEQSIMFCMPVVIAAAMNFMGDGFMDVIYTTALGRIVSTITVVIFITAFLLSQKIMNIKI